MQTKQVLAGLAIMEAVAESIREAGQLPAGPLYAHLMGLMDLQQFDLMIVMLARAGLVRRQGDLVVWCAPTH